MSFANWGNAGLLFITLSACQPEGGVKLQLDLPEPEELSPISGDRLAEITLVAWDETGDQTSESRPASADGPGIDLGRLPTGAPFVLGVEMHDANGRLIGFGRSEGAVEAEADEVIDVPIAVRRPFVYVPGGGEDPFGELPSTLATFDSTLDPAPDDGAMPGPDYKGAIEFAMRVTAAVPTGDGREVVVVGQGPSGGVLALVPTASHQAAGGTQIAIAADPVDLAVAPDGAYAVVAHGGAEGGITVVDMARLRGGDGAKSATFAPLGPVGAVAVSGGDPSAEARAFALLDRAPGRIDLTSVDIDALRTYRTERVACSAPPSTVVVVPLADPTELGLRHTLEAPIHDIASTADGSTLFLADACGDRVATMDPNSGAVDELATLADATTVAVQGRRVLAAGSVTPGGGAATVELVTIGVDGSDENRIVLPARQERARIEDLSEPGQEVEIAVDADTVFAYDLAIAPDGGQVGLLVEAYHHADATSVFPEMELDTYEYLLVSASGGAQVHRLRNYCLAKIAVTLFELSCAANTPGQDAIPDEQMYVPLHLSVLYGDR